MAEINCIEVGWIDRTALAAIEDLSELPASRWYSVTRGVPVEVGGYKNVRNYPLDERCFFHPAPAADLCEQWRQHYPDAVVVETVRYV
jgi:hypothetical protein